MVPSESLMIGAKNLKAPMHMQCVGLKDANGVDIYEGDILEERQGSFFSVVWDAGWAKFKLQHPPKTIQYPEWNRGKKMKVVGNIHENPELMQIEPQ